MPSTKAGPIHLNFESRRQVVVTPDERDRFVTTAAEAARACKLAEVGREWQEQFEAFLSHINNWCEGFSDVIQSGYVTIGDSSLNVLICLKGDEYIFDFEDTLVDLDLQLADQFPQCIAEVLQVPNQAALTDELSSEAMCVYGDGGGSPETSRAQQDVS